MIYTITFNPSIDYVVDIKDFKLGALNRTEKERKFPGGKGINVSRVLRSLGVENVALGFTGGFTGEHLKELLALEDVKTDFIKVTGDTRINFKLKVSSETEINGRGPEIIKADLETLFRKTEKFRENDILVLSGNIQSNLPKDTYFKLQQRCLDKNVKFVIDTTGEALTCTLCNKPFLIKPNVNELGDIFKVEIKAREDIIEYGTKLLDMGAENVIVSMASEGAILICKEGVYHVSSPKGKIKNSVGAGDSLIAGFLAKFSEGCNKSESLKFGVACGSATAFSYDLCKKSEVEELLDMVKVIKIK